ncbi:hypothetical protein FP2506_13199 [Fulvimarina pelagi HTCC2506]|uniref:Glycosyltransferase n=1 Tax=Fulvimarina pelagi HTCC2506 TaxID=314231 RepID=Q0FXE1_9HYPH|nr:TIGR04282 family arsenosugar biosynthesis glycosyltransferase [Fulvimarina pelagi]EAU39658.1 hypothetical protein FP2506_13199 [Fulvimarina pelagi HTCC2506]
MPSFDRPTVVVFAKAPILGFVKTRLAQTIGDEAALALYKMLLKRTVEEVTDPRWDTVVAATPDETALEDRYWPHGVTRIKQGGGDLGARMLRPLLKARINAPVAVVGSDVPNLSVAEIAAAFEALRERPFVFGPAVDGGFYLVGVADRAPKTIFDNVEWSTDDTLRRVLDNLPADSVSFVGTLDDLDDRDSLNRHIQAGRL